MNRIKIIMLSMLAVAVLFSSCKDDDEDDDPVVTPSGPILTLDPESSVEAWVGDQVAIEYTVSTATANEIVSLDITTNETEIASVFFGEELDNNFVNDSIVFTMPAGPAGNPWVNGGFFDVTFVATHDVEGIQYTTTKSVTCTYVEPADPLTEYAGVINNLIGPDEGAWDLVLNEAVSSASANDPNKDMRNTTTTSSTAPEIFETEWDSPAGSTFILTAWDAADYAGLTPDMISMEFAGGTSTSLVSDVQVGQVYIANLRGMDEYAAILITAVNITDTVGDNSDFISFAYKK